MNSCNGHKRFCSKRLLLFALIYHLAERLDRRFCNHRVPSSIPVVGFFLFFFPWQRGRTLVFCCFLLFLYCIFFCFFLILYYIFVGFRNLSQNIGAGISSGFGGLRILNIYNFNLLLFQQMNICKLAGTAMRGSIFNVCIYYYYY